MDNVLSIRFAVPDDVPQILSYVRQLAKYEKLEHEVVATKELLYESLFGKRAFAEVILAEYAKEPAGFALFFHNYSTFLAKPGIYLEDLFVPKQRRGKGIGKALLVRLAQIAKERNCGRLEWWVLDWNEPAIEFYKSLGSKPMSDWTVFRLSDSAFSKLASQS